MHRYAALSGVLHIAILVMAAFGLLQWTKKEIDLQTPLPIEIVDRIEETAKSPNPTPAALKTEEPPKDIPQPQPKSEPTPPPTPAPPVEKTSPPVEKAEPTPEPPAPNEDAVPVKSPEPKPEEKKPTPPKPAPKKPEPKPIVPPKQKPVAKKELSKPKPKPEEDSFAAILKNLDKQKSKVKGTSKTSISQDAGMGGELADYVAASELDRVRKQIEEAWHLPAGLKDVHTFQVSIKISMNPDRTVRDARVVSTGQMADPTYRILAESALRAVNEFRHQPLLLPENKYNLWKEITMVFDPRNVL